MKTFREYLAEAKINESTDINKAATQKAAKELLKAAKERDLCSTVRIVLTPDIFDKIDLEIIRNNWQ